MKSLTITEIDALAAHLPAQGRAMVLLGFRHGMRPSEVVDLRWDDIDLAARTIRVRRLKNSNATVQPLAEVELDALCALPVDEKGGMVFPSKRRGKRLSRTTFWRWFNEAARLSGLSAGKRHPHCLKHSLGFALVAANVNMAVIKAAMGHKSIGSTAIYAVPTEEQVGQLVAEALR